MGHYDSCYEEEDRLAREREQKKIEEMKWKIIDRICDIGIEQVLAEILVKAKIDF